MDFFSFNTFNILFHSLFACVISDEKSAINLTLVPLQERCFYSLVSFMIFSVSLVFCNSNIICLDVDSLVFILLGVIRGYPASWICGLVSVINFENSQPLLLRYFFCSLSFAFGVLIMHMLQLLKLFHSSCRFCFFFLPLFFLFVFQCGKFLLTYLHIR